MVDELLGIFWKYRGRIIGGLLGLLIGWLFLTRGFFATLFLVGCILCGYWLGKGADGEGDLGSFLQRFRFPDQR